MANFKIINMTKRDIVLINDNSIGIKYPASRHFLKCKEDKRYIGRLDQTPIYSIKYSIENLPEPKPNTFYIVSSKVYEASGFREDFLTVVESSSKHNTVYITGLKRG